MEKQVEKLERGNALLGNANERLRESEEKFKTIFENANDHIVYVDVDGAVIDVNEEVKDLFGYAREEVVGEKFYGFGALSSEDWQRCIELSGDLLTGKTTETQVLELQARHKNGTKVFIEVNPRLVSRDDEIKGILAITRDITACRQEQELLRRHKDGLERLVNERTYSLEEENTTLRAVLPKTRRSGLLGNTRERAASTKSAGPCRSRISMPNTMLTYFAIAAGIAVLLLGTITEGSSRLC
ncbi:MAG: PAS domain S-box protein [Chloroflexi bacterium]|nr:PAS domain S-box protein [Chloroflexota bacterium]